jgi:O-antigen/teichoic acid export membrane protein
VIKQILHTFFTKISASALGFATIILISQVLGAEQKGEQAFIVLNIAILMQIFTLVGNSTLIYFTPRYRFNLLVIPSVLWILLMIVLCVIVAFFVPNIIFDHFVPVLIISSLASLTEISQFLLLGKQKIIQANRVKIISPLLTITILFIQWLFNDLDSVNNFIFALFVSYVISTGYGIIIVYKFNERNQSVPTVKELTSMTKLIFAKGATKQIGSIIQTLNYRLLFYILAIYFGDKIVGVYSNAVSLTEAVMLFGSSLALVQYSKLSNTSDRVKSRLLTLKMTKINAAFTSLCLLIMCLLPSDIYVWLFGEDFVRVGYIIRLLSVGILLLSCSSNFTQYFASQGNFSISTFASAAGLIITLSLGLWLIPMYSIEGAAVSTVISFAVTTVIEAVYFFFLFDKKTSK